LILLDEDLVVGSITGAPKRRPREEPAPHHSEGAAARNTTVPPSSPICPFPSGEAQRGSFVFGDLQLTPPPLRRGGFGDQRRRGGSCCDQRGARTPISCAAEDDHDDCYFQEERPRRRRRRVEFVDEPSHFYDQQAPRHFLYGSGYAADRSDARQSHARRSRNHHHYRNTSYRNARPFTTCGTGCRYAEEGDMAYTRQHLGRRPQHEADVVTPEQNHHSHRHAVNDPLLPEPEGPSRHLPLSKGFLWRLKPP
jgi:hypothetical protein